MREVAGLSKLLEKTEWTKDEDTHSIRRVVKAVDAMQIEIGDQLAVGKENRKPMKKKVKLMKKQASQFGAMKRWKWSVTKDKWNKRPK